MRQWSWQAVLSGCLIGSATLMLLWVGSWPRPSTLAGQPTGAALVQISYDEHLEAEELADYCHNEMVAVEQLMANIGSLTGTSLLWAANQVTIRLQNTGSLA